MGVKERRENLREKIERARRAEGGFLRTGGGRGGGGGRRRGEQVKRFTFFDKNKNKFVTENLTQSELERKLGGDLVNAQVKDPTTGKITQGFITQSQLADIRQRAQQEARIRLQEKEIERARRLDTRIQESLLRRQGFRISREGDNIVARKGGEKILITRTGATARAPESGRIDPRIVSKLREIEERERRVGDKRVVTTAVRDDGSLLSPIEQTGAQPGLMGVLLGGEEKRIQQQEAIQMVKDRGGRFGVFVQKNIPEEIPQILEKKAVDLRAGFDPDTRPGIITFTREVAPASLEFTAGGIEELRERPGRALLTAGTFVLVPPALKVIGKAVKFATVMGRFPKVTKMLGVTLGAGIGGAFLGIKGKEIIEAQKPFKKAGRITSGEIAPMVGGSFAGIKITQKTVGLFRTFGRTEILAQDLVPAEVLSGAKRFPEAPRSQQLGRFLSMKTSLPGQTVPAGFHTTGISIKRQFIVTQGASEFPGLFVSSDVSPHFLRIGGESRLVGLNIFEQFSTPTILQVTPAGFRVTPFVRVAGGGFRFVRTTSGVADLPLLKTEIEAILPPGTTLTRTGRRFFTRLGGQRIPIDEFKFTGITETTGGTGRILKGVSSSSSGISRSSIVTPASLGVSLASSRSTLKSTSSFSGISSNRALSSSSLRSSGSSFRSSLSRLSSGSFSSGSFSSGSFSSGFSSGGFSRGRFSSGFSFSGGGSSIQRITTGRPPPPITPGTGLRNNFFPRRKRKRTGGFLPGGRPFKFTATLEASVFGKAGFTTQRLTGLELRRLRI